MSARRLGSTTLLLVSLAANLVLFFTPAPHEAAPQILDPDDDAVRLAARVDKKPVPEITFPLDQAEWAGNLLAHTDTASFRRVTYGEVSFWFPADDVWHAVDFIRQNEASNVQYWADAIAVRQRTGRSCYIADVGSNGGYYSMLSRALGCAVLAVDAQPRCLERLASGAAVNGWATGWTTRWTAVSNKANVQFEVGADRCSGLWAIRDSKWINDESASQVTVRGADLLTLVEGWVPRLADPAPASAGDDAVITALKIDAEGSEIAVLASALPLLRARRILHILVEVVPNRINKISSAAEVRSTVEGLYGAGYACKPINSQRFFMQSEALTTILENIQSGAVDWTCSLQQPE